MAVEAGSLSRTSLTRAVAKATANTVEVRVRNPTGGKGQWKVRERTDGAAQRLATVVERALQAIHWKQRLDELSPEVRHQLQAIFRWPDWEDTSESVKMVITY